MVEGNSSATQAEALLVNERENMDLTGVVAIILVEFGEELFQSDQLSEARSAQSS